LDDYETKFTAWWKVESDARFGELLLNDIDQSYFNKIWIHETRGKTLDQALALVASVKKVDASYVTGAAGSETVVRKNVMNAIKDTHKAPSVFIAKVYYYQHLSTLNKTVGTGNTAYTVAAAKAAGFNSIHADSAAGSEVTYWVDKQFRKSMLTTLLTMYNDVVVAFEADILKTAGSETDLVAKIATYTPAITKANVIAAVGTGPIYTLAGGDDAAKFTNIFAKINTESDGAAKTVKIKSIAKLVAVNWFKTNAWKAEVQSSGYRIQNYTYTASVAATAGFPNTWDAATILPTYLMDPAGANTDAAIKYNRSNIVIAMNEYVPTCHYASLTPAKFSAVTTNSAFANVAEMIADAGYNTPAKACGQYAMLQAKTNGWLEALYNADTTATITAAASMDSLFCTATAGIETYAKFQTKQLFSSADFMQVIEVSRHNKVKATSGALSTIAVDDLAAGIAIIKAERERVFALSHSLRDLRKKAQGGAGDTADILKIFPCPLQLLQLADAKYDNKVLYVDDALIQKDTGANRFMYFAIYNMWKYYPGTAYDAATNLNKDAQTNDTLGGTAATGDWKDSAIADGNFGIMLGKFVVNVFETVRVKSLATADKVYYGELDMYGIDSDMIFKAGWTNANLIAIVKLCRAKVVSNAALVGGVIDAHVATIKYKNYISSNTEVALTAAQIATLKLSPEMVAGLQITQLDTTYKVRGTNAWVYSFNGTKQDNTTKFTASQFWAFRLNYALANLGVDRNTYNNVSYLADKMYASVTGDLKTPKVDKLCG